MTIDEKNKIIIDNEALIHYFIKKLKFYIKDYEYEDYYQSACVAILKGLDNFDSSKGSLSNYIYNSMKLHFYNTQKRTNKIDKHYDIFSLNHKVYLKDNDTELIDLISEKADSVNVEDEAVYKVICDKFLKTIPEKHAEIFRYSKIYGTVKCGIKFGLSQPYCSRIQSYIEMELLKGYGYILTKDDLNLIDFKLTKNDEKQISIWKSKSLNELNVNVGNSAIYKKLLQRKYFKN